MHDGEETTRRKKAWTTALVLVSIVAGGTAAVGLVTRVQTSTTPGATASDRTATTTASAEPAPGSSAGTWTTPPVTFPTQVPGCDTVDAPSEGGLTWSTFSVVGEKTYDNPRYPWFSGPKATAMSASLTAALPDDVGVEFAQPDQSLVFTPIEDLRNEAGEIAPGDTSASGTIARGEHAGSLWVTVEQSDRPVPACVAGELVERRRSAEGAIVDLQDTWTESDGVRRLSRSATAYLPDDTRVYAVVSNDLPDGGISGALPLTLDEVAAIAAAPGLRVSAPVPPGTPSPPATCSSRIRSEDGSPVTREDVARLDRTLADVRAKPPTGWTIDSVGRFQPSGRTAACAALDVHTSAGTGKVTIGITGGQELRPAPDPYDPAQAYSRTEFGTLADGSTVERDGYAERRTVTVTRPSGTQVRIDADFPAHYEDLESLATTSGLEM